ncbi:hypothetical protein [Nakamurella lactea]|uniref:hypothetical protein n=1 Tax=Nakamurella lactea TaxID=459515 RepID=UPI0004229DAF|nr:hypothetical protein [Nakamurella lactea]
MVSNRTICFLGGLLVGNCGPHLASAVTGRRHLTPLAGKDSSPAVNAVWGLLNLTGGLALVGRGARTGETRWDRRLVAFNAGVATFAVWMAGTEAAIPINSGARQTNGAIAI